MRGGGEKAIAREEENSQTFHWESKDIFCNITMCIKHMKKSIA